MLNTVAQTEFVGNPGISEGQLKGIFLRACQSAAVVFNASLLVSSKCAGILNARRFTNNPHQLCAPPPRLKDRDSCAACRDTHKHKRWNIHAAKLHSLLSPDPSLSLCLFISLFSFSLRFKLQKKTHLQKSIILDHAFKLSLEASACDFGHRNYDVIFKMCLSDCGWKWSNH